jgi:hypothetical protein
VDIKSINKIIEEISPYYKKKGGPEAEHKLVYDSSTETLEPVYFFILDLMEDFKLAPEKLIDNFSSSPGSGHFAELGQRATVMQQQGAKILGDVNTVLRSVLNIVYDLKDFRIRLQSYDDLKSRDPNTSQAARLSLKQVWLDKVDIAKGNTSIKALALGQAGFQTLLDAFLVVDDVKKVKDLDLNDRVMRIVTSRISEFNIWLDQSEKELRKRYELERNYLKSQVNSLKLYTRWARPYLVAASRLQSKDLGRDARMVNVFNTMILELTLLGKIKLEVKESALEGDLPFEFTKESFIRSVKRDYHTCILVDFKFRGIPQRVAQQSHFAFGGKAEITFRAYALNDDELYKLNQELDKSDLEDALGLISGATDDSLKQMQDEIDFFLEDKDEYAQKEAPRDNSNPFLALIGHYDRAEAPKKRQEPKPGMRDIIVNKDNWLEKTHLRKLSASKATELAFKIFEVYKKAHGMPAYDTVF